MQGFISVSYYWKTREDCVWVPKARRRVALFWTRQHSAQVAHHESPISSRYTCHSATASLRIFHYRCRFLSTNHANSPVFPLWQISLSNQTFLLILEIQEFWYDARCLSRWSSGYLFYVRDLWALQTSKEGAVYCPYVVRCEFSEGPIDWHRKVSSRWFSIQYRKAAMSASYERQGSYTATRGLDEGWCSCGAFSFEGQTR